MAKRRWITFSLRTLALILTVACVWLALQVNRAQRQRAVVERILELGGEVRYAHEFNESLFLVPQATPPGPAWIRQFLGDEYFATVANAAFYGRRGANVGDAELAELTRVKTFRRIAVYDTQVSDAGLVPLKDLKNLECLGLDGSQVTDKGMAHVRELIGLRQLYLSKLPITDDGLAQLTSLKNLNRLWLGGTQVTDEGMRHLAELTKIRDLVLWGTPITDAGLVHLEGLSGLESLDVMGTRVSNVGLEKLQTALPNCRVIPRRVPEESPDK